jgi:hypothetical protein
LINILNRKVNIKKNKIKDKSMSKNQALKILRIIKKSDYDCNIKDIKSLDFIDLIENIFMKYKSYINFLINLYFYEGTTFQKKQQIDNIQNTIILSIRFLINYDIIDIHKVISYIHKIINKIYECSKFNNINKIKIYDYDLLFDKLLLSFLILLDFDEFKNIFKYIFKWILPYFTFWLYLRHKIVLNDFYFFYNDESKEKINMNDFKQYLKENNKQINNYLILYFKKLLIISELAKIDNKDNEDNYNIKEISSQNLFSLLNMENIYQSISKNDNGEIIFIDLIEQLPEIISSEIQYKNNFFINYDKIFNILINNIKNLKQEKFLMEIDIISLFIPNIFQIIEIHYL